MARARNIKPQFFKHDGLADVSRDARLLFIGLWCLADCEGRLKNKPRWIQAELFPYDDDANIDRWLDELANHPEQFIVRYEVEGNRYIEIPGFVRHQNPHKREKDSGSDIPPNPGLGRDKAGIDPGQGRDQSGTSPADSLLLNPDSLIIPPSVAHDVGKQEEEKSTNPIWDDGLQLLIRSGVSEQSARSFLGMAIKQHGEGALNEAISITLLNEPADPKSYLLACLKNYRGDSQPSGSKNNGLDGAASSQTRDVLLGFPFIRHTQTGEVFPVEEMEIRPESPATLYFKGNSFPVAMLEGLQEMPT